jgi:hypothetical protein
VGAKAEMGAKAEVGAKVEVGAKGAVINLKALHTRIASRFRVSSVQSPFGWRHKVYLKSVDYRSDQPRSVIRSSRNRGIMQ